VPIIADDIPGVASEATPVLTVPLVVEGIATSSEPLAMGIPFARGTLRDAAALSLRDREGENALLQTTALARWSDDSVKWALVEFVARQAGDWNLNVCETSYDVPATALRVCEGLQSSLVIDTGVATFYLNDTTMPPFARIVVDDSDVIDHDGMDAVLRDGDGRAATLRVDRFVVEARGPVRATVRVEGAFDGAVRCRFVARYSFYAGSRLAKLELTLHNPNRAHHPGGLWDLGDRGSIFFHDFTLSLRLDSRERTAVTYSAEPGMPPRTDQGSLAIYQDSSGGENWRSRNHLNRDGRVPCTFRGYRVRTNDTEFKGLRADPVVRVANAHVAISAAIPEFWRQFPKAIEVGDGALRIGLFPSQWDDLFELQAGEQKTHTVWLHFGAASSPPDVLDWVHRPMTVRASPEWYADSGAVSWLSSSTTANESRLTSMLRAAVRGEDSLFERREIIDEYGWRHFGDVYADHEAMYFKGPSPIVSHYNNQYDMIYGAALQYLSTGDAAWLRLLDPMARHAIDIDIYHTTRDRAAYSGGMFWHTEHYNDAATCTHRSFSRMNKRPGVPSGGGPCNEHVYTTGLLHYHYLTGNPQARDAVLGLADWVIRCDDGSLTLLGILDDGPTGLASATRHPDYHGPGRGAGNAVNALVDGWLLSREPQYLAKAEELIHRVVHPHDDVDSLGLLDAENRWSYTVFLATLARYLDLKEEAGQLDSMYAYARASLLRYAQWMLHHERPYLDHPDHLEYPTETWAAHDFRKANVLRYAARYADMVHRPQLMARADDLAASAAEHLLKFDKPNTTRALAILMVELSRDAFFRGLAPDPAPADVAFDDQSFEVRRSFASQRRRVVAQLTSVKGLVRSIFHLANPGRWHRFLTSRT